jgi:hypothetical protein
MGYSANKETVSRLEVAASREEPNRRRSGIHSEIYKELVRDPITNRQALVELIEDCLGYIYGVHRLTGLIETLREEDQGDPMVLAGLLDPEEDEEPQEESEEDMETNRWLNIDQVREWVEGADKLLGGEVTEQTIQACRGLIAQAYYEAELVIKDQEEIINEFDPIEEAVIVEAAERMRADQKTKVIRSIQAYYYLTTVVGGLEGVIL